MAIPAEGSFGWFVIGYAFAAFGYVAAAMVDSWRRRGGPASL